MQMDLVDTSRRAPSEKQLLSVQELRDSLTKDDYSDTLWRCVVAYEGYLFRTSGRGRTHSGAVDFYYKRHISKRSGEPTDELVISTRPDSKTITRSSVELGLSQCLLEQKREGYVRGPKRMSVFGASYLYAMFTEWGLISPEKR